MEIWHNPRCSKSRATLARIEEAGVTPVIRRYLDDAPSPAAIEDACSRLGIEPWDLVRMGESIAKELGLAQWPRDDASREKWVAAMSANPSLIERPVVLSDDGRAVLGRPPEGVDDLL